MSGKISYVFREATTADLNEIFQLLKTSFFPFEPLNISMGSSGPEKLTDFHPLLALRDDGLSFVAVVPQSESKERIVAVVINTDATEETWKEAEKLRDSIGNASEQKVLDLNIKAYKDINIWNKVRVDKMAHFQILSVHPDFTRRGIGSGLGRRSLAAAKSGGYKLAYAPCTSFYTAKICECLGMECVYTLPYKDYIGADGKPVFNPSSPHTEYKVFIAKM